MIRRRAALSLLPENEADTGKTLYMIEKEHIMSKKVTVAAVQMTYGLENALAKVREAASQGAQIILLPELFENWYFCQEKSYENYHLATTLEENPAVCELRKSRTTSVLSCRSATTSASATPPSTRSPSLTRTAASSASTARPTFRTTIFIRKVLFHPGRHGLQGLGHRVCENRRGHLLGPVVPGVRTLHGTDGCGNSVLPDRHRLGAILTATPCRTGAAVCRGHAAANIMPLIAANRIGTETVKPTPDNQNQSSSLTFYGSSFIADETGALVEQADRENDAVLTHTFDLDEIREMRSSWGVFRDRRPEMYGAMRSFG